LWVFSYQNWRKYIDNIKDYRSTFKNAKPFCTIQFPSKRERLQPTGEASDCGDPKHVVIPFKTGKTATGVVNLIGAINFLYRRNSLQSGKDCNSRHLKRLLKQHFYT
jgi:hypothetical protein